jgi:hypothetical protein
LFGWRSISVLSKPFIVWENCCLFLTRDRSMRGGAAVHDLQRTGQPVLLLNEGNQNMTDDLMQAAMSTWAAKDLPARIDVETTAKLLGFTESDMQILLAVGKLTPLNDPDPNAPKWFAAVEMSRLATDQD